MRVLVIRMSSLGDILLATSFLESLPVNARVDWVVRSEFAFALQGHPKIQNLISFSKKSGLRSWLQLIRKLSEEKYDARVDLHRSLRSRVAFLYLRFLDAGRFRKSLHLEVSKERMRTSLYFILKELAPVSLRPTPFWLRFARLGALLHQSKTLNKPSYLSVLESSGLSGSEVLEKYELSEKEYFAIMPAASFRTKEWSPKRYFELTQSVELKNLIPLLVGRETDHACRALRDEFKNHGILFRDALQERDFKITAMLLKHARFYVGSDTGLAHLAEAVGTRSVIVYGPTRPDLGFGPWRNESTSVAVPLACAPCSKDGKLCYRFWSPYACLKELDVDRVKKAFRC